MSFSIFEEFDKSTTDIFSDDFDSKYSLKIKSAGPCGLTLTTNTTAWAPAKKGKDGKPAEKPPALTTKVSAKWAHKSGFTLDKLELDSAGALTTETSLTSAAPGLKLEFKGNDTNKGDLSFTYNHSLATVTGKIDALNLQSAGASINAGTGPLTAGASADLTLDRLAVKSSTFGLGVGYTLNKTLFAGLRVNNNLTEYKGLVQYAAAPNLTLAGTVSTGGKDGTLGVVGTVYKCNPDTTIKVKASSNAVINASVKQAFPNKLNIIGTAEVPAKDLSSYKVGVNITLG